MSTTYDLDEADVLFDAFTIALAEVGGDIGVIFNIETDLLRSLIVTTGASRQKEVACLSGDDTGPIAGSAVSLFRLLCPRPERRFFK